MNLEFSNLNVMSVVSGRPKFKIWEKFKVYIPSSLGSNYNSNKIEFSLGSFMIETKFKVRGLKKEHVDF